MIQAPAGSNPCWLLIFYSYVWFIYLGFFSLFMDPFGDQYCPIFPN